MLFFVLTFMKIDFRLDEIEPGYFHDDSAYYYHAQTLAVDLDLDYSNQLAGTDKRNLNLENGNPVPVHPIGVGLFAFPFLFFSNIISLFFNINSVVSFNYFIYSFVPYFYFLISIYCFYYLIQRKMKEDILLKLLYYVFSTGLTYYIFERFSMSHLYEFVSVPIIFYLLEKYNLNRNKLRKTFMEIIIPILLFCFFSIRWSNYTIFLLPIIYRLIYKNKINLFRRPFFIFSSLISLVVFLIHTKFLYGIYTLNPSKIFLLVENRLQENYQNLINPEFFIENIYQIFRSLFIICFSKEFGIFYFAPILFSGFVFAILFLYKKNYVLGFLLLIFQFLPVLSIVIFQNTSYSYGYRYLFINIGLNLIIYFHYFYENRIITTYLNFFSIIGLLGVLFFETSIFVTLSEEYVLNSFGELTKYSNPSYLTGLFKTITIPNSYLNIIFTSMLGIFILKLFSLFVNLENFISNFYTIDEDIERLIYLTNNISWLYVFLTIFFSSMILFQINYLISIGKK